MAMIGQVHAGMWRRNGFALINQLYFYQNVKCRAEMLDRDVVMLQVNLQCFWRLGSNGGRLMDAEKLGVHLKPATFHNNNDDDDDGLLV